MKSSQNNIFCVANAEDLGISHCMGEKGLGRFCPVSLHPIYPSQNTSMCGNQFQRVSVTYEDFHTQLGLQYSIWCRAWIRPYGFLPILTSKCNVLLYLCILQAAIQSWRIYTMRSLKGSFGRNKRDILINALGWQNSEHCQSPTYVSRLVYSGRARNVSEVPVEQTCQGSYRVI